MKFNLKLALLKLVLVNLIPVFGVIFLDWKLFEIGVAYILETTAIFLVHDLDVYFIDKRTRLPVYAALLQLIITMMTFSAIMFASVLIIFLIAEPPAETPALLEQQVTYRLTGMNIPVALSVFFAVELVTYYIRKRKDLAHLSNSHWRVIRRILYSHLYMVVSLIVFAYLPQNPALLLPFFIGLKMVFEYTAEDGRIYKALWEKFLGTRWGAQFKPEPVTPGKGQPRPKRKKVPAYLLKSGPGRRR